MFAGLEDINWQQLEHAYGTAEEVPGWLKSLASQEVESDVLTQLSLSLCHQGTVYSASATAVPYLIELLTSTPFQGKGWILRLLARMAHGGAYHRQHYSYFSEERRQDPEFQQQLAEEELWAQRTREAVRLRLPVYLKLLAGADPYLRMEAAYTLAQLTADSASILPRLISRLEQEDDPLARTSVVLSLGVLAQPTGAIRALLEPLLQTPGEGKEALVRYAAAVSLARLFREETTETAVRLLIDLVIEPVPQWLFDTYVELPWVDGRLSHVAGFILRRQLSPARLRFVLPQLLKAMEVVEEYDVDEVIRMLLYVAFGRHRLPEQVAARHLTEEQHAVLQAIARCDRAWHSPYTVDSQVAMTDVLVAPDAMVVSNTDIERRGLPSTQQDLLDFLG